MKIFICLLFAFCFSAEINAASKLPCCAQDFTNAPCQCSSPPTTCPNSPAC